MRRHPLLPAAFALGALLALGACGHHGEEAAADAGSSVEMPAEEAISGVAAVPAPDSGANAAEAASTRQAPEDMAAAAAAVAASAEGRPAPDAGQPAGNQPQ